MRTRQRGQVSLDALTVGLITLIRPLLYIFSNQLAVDLFFEGSIKAEHKTRFFLEKFVARYVESIDTLNRALIISVVFALVAFIPAGDTLKIPLVDLQVSNRQWLRLCPAISYGVQLFTLIAMCWFLLLRRGLQKLRSSVGTVDQFGDVSNLMLGGVLGSLWIVFSIRHHLPSRLHIVWFFPTMLLCVLIVVTPSLLCGYFVRELFLLKDFVPAFAYAALLIPSLGLSIALVALGAVAGIPELWSEKRAG